MSNEKPPPAPKGLQSAGRRLWRAILADYELDQHEMLLLVQACRTADILDRLADAAEDAPLTVNNFRGDPVANPLLTEQRQQSIVLARLLAALRLPTGEDDTERRPQRRGGVRGVYTSRLYGTRNPDVA
jgi:hypothetical protein